MTTVVMAVATGVGVLLAGNLPWVAALAPLNLRVLPAVPWAIAPMALYLWLYWRYIGGRIGAVESAGFRRASLRANPLSAEVWTMAIPTGLVAWCLPRAARTRGRSHAGRRTPRRVTRHELSDTPVNPPSR